MKVSLNTLTCNFTRTRLQGDEWDYVIMSAMKLFGALQSDANTIGPTCPT